MSGYNMSKFYEFYKFNLIAAPKAIALKSHFRRSSIYDKKPQYDLDNSAIIIDESFEDNIQTKVKVTKVKINKTLIVSSISSDSASTSSSDKENTTNDNSNTSEKKHDKIQKQIENIVHDNRSLIDRLKKPDNDLIFTPVQNSKSMNNYYLKEYIRLNFIIFSLSFRKTGIN